jgi:ring-1,2-phenylacetyl-CoA epoxidase subunit PaaC
MLAKERALRLGDDGLILGQRLSEWCGHAPMLEVDLALANIALDLIGQATLFLGVAGDADALAFRRDVLDFRNCLLVEQPNGDFAQTIARQFLFSNWHELYLRELAKSDDAALAAIAAKSVKEVAYHTRYASEWVVRLGDGTEESRRRMVAGLDWMWRFTGELFADDTALKPEWETRIERTLREAGLDVPKPVRPVLGGREGHHSEHLGHLLSEMQFLQRAYPGATW